LRPTLPIDVFVERVLGIGITTLDHKTWNHSVEDRPVVKARLGQLDKVLHMIRSHIRIQLNVDVSELRLDNGFRTFAWRRSDRFHLSLPATTREKTEHHQHSAQYKGAHGHSITHHTPPHQHRYS